MDRSARGERGPKLVLLVLCAAALLLLAACVDEGTPTSYDNTVETNFIDGCKRAALDDAAISPVAPRYCGCAWERLITEVSFEDFKNLDDEVKDDPDKISNVDPESTATQLRAIFADCRVIHTRS